MGVDLHFSLGGFSRQVGRIAIISTRPHSRASCTEETLRLKIFHWIQKD
jgi:hypothetical protein